ncbi:metabotropic glycine receptor-like [Cylas formicarius]|uniref:metabotropic glycine receptor-like n=1 Tax=Cylas formicarius TaxID=197179 RepID=UPI002958DEF8|nr:metabotropic glycine receptor-like [Cylas formicarius]
MNRHPYADTRSIMKLAFIFLLVNYVCAEFIHEELEIRHKRSRLIRLRRNGSRAHRFKDNLNLDKRAFMETGIFGDNATITKAHGENVDVNFTTTHTYAITSSYLYMNDNSLGVLDSSAINQTEPDGQRDVSDVNKTVSDTYMEEVKRRNFQESVIIPHGNVDIVTHFLRIVESQHLLGDNCTAGTNLSLGEGVVDRYAQERFRIQADVAVNKANMLTRIWKYAEPEVVASEHLLYASVSSMVEFDDVIFAAGNCYDKHEYKDYLLFCPYAYRLPEGPINVKDLAVEYKYLSNSSEWFYIARKNAEKVINNYDQITKGYMTYRFNSTAHDVRVSEEILSVRYEDGKWSKPYYDCGGGNIWMLTYTVPFFGYRNNTYYFKGTSGIDIDLRHVDIDQCPTPPEETQINIFAASDKCKKATTQCVPIPGLGFRRGSYKCVCKQGFYFPDTNAERRFYNGIQIEEEYEKRILGELTQYDKEGIFECLACPEGCESCVDDRPCVVSLNWVLRSVILILSCITICCLPIVAFFTWQYGNVKVVRAASPVLLRIIALGAFFIYSTMIVMYPKPSVYTCTARIWLREIGFSLTYGALMLKTWRISVIFRVRSAKVIKITDVNLLKRLGVILAVFAAFLTIRTIVAPPIVIVGRTSDDLKAFLCRTDWWDHLFSILEVLFLAWGIRLCIVVRKAPSEFNESRFISMAIYNEFLLSVFLNISMLFLQKPANPDLMYIIFFCHTQLTVTLLLCLIFGSKVFVVLKNKGKEDESSSMVYKTPSKFVSKGRTETSQFVSANSSLVCQEVMCTKYREQDIQEEFLRLYTQLEVLKERNMRVGNRHLASKINAMQDAARMCDNDQNQKERSFVILKSNSNISIVADRSTVEPSVINNENKGDKTDELKIEARVAEESTTSTYQTSDVAIKAKTESNGRHLVSGHARTHSIVINLDDKSRFTDEITV